MTPLYGHTSEETAFLIQDYPYGRTLRCQKKMWIEHSPTKGYRCCSKTENPKTGKWNATHKSTYSRLAGNLFLDEIGHCHWSSLSEGSNEKDVLSYIENFPEADLSNILPFVIARMVYATRTSEGKANFSFNGVPSLPSDSDIEKAKEELLTLQKCKDLLKQ